MSTMAFSTPVSGCQSDGPFQAHRRMTPLLSRIHAEGDRTFSKKAQAVTVTRSFLLRNP